MKTLLLALALFAAGGWQDAVLHLVGADSVEELDESELERFESLLKHPLDLNGASRSRLLSSGLLSGYQVASIEDYRYRHGDILSFTELAAVDGIGPATSEALRYFIRLEPVRRKLRPDVSGTARTVVRKDEGADTEKSYGAKLKAAYGWMEASASYRDGFAGNLSFYGKRHLGKVVVGDYSARYGQGLLMWNGFSLSGLSSVSSFARNASGVSPSNSWSPSARMRGVAADINFGAFSASASAALDGTATAGFSWLSRRWHAGASAAFADGKAGLSADWRVGLRNISLYGEAALDMVSMAPALVAGVIWAPSYGTKYAFMLRAYPSQYAGVMPGAVRSSTKVRDEVALSAGCQKKWLTLTMDALTHPSSGAFQLKALSVVTVPFEMWGVDFKPSVRVSERWRPQDARPLKTDLRFDLDASSGPWMAHYRFNVLAFRDLAWVWYLETGYKDKFSVYLRGGIFKVDNWDDRIYVYERDAPGSFNVPVCYGRGWNASLVAVWRKITVRLSSVSYPWTLPTNSSKPTRLEFRAQLGF